MGIYAALSDSTVEDVLMKFAGKPFSQFKPELADLTVAKLSPITEKMRRLTADPGHVDTVLRQGAVRAREIAATTMIQVRDLMGFLA